MVYCIQLNIVYSSSTIHEQEYCVCNPPTDSELLNLAELAWMKSEAEIRV